MRAIGKYMKSLLKEISVILLLFIQPLVLAKDTVTVEGTAYPTRQTAQEVAWELRGTEHFKYKIFFSVFTAAYYKQVNGEGEKLTFTYTRNLKADDIREQAMKTLTANNDENTLKKYATLTQKIQSAYVNIKEGDSYSVTAVPGKGTWLHYNEEEVFYTENAEFGDWYMDIWLGNPPISESLKEALMKDSSS